MKVEPWPGSIRPRSPAVQLDQLLGQGEPEARALPLLGAESRSAGTPRRCAPGPPGRSPGRCRRPRRAPRRLARGADVDAPPCGVNLTAFESRLNTTWRMRRSSASTSSTSGSGSRVQLRPRSWSRAPGPSPPRAPGLRAARTAPRSSSTCPASTLDRSRMSLISSSRWSAEEWMSSRYSSCFSFTSPNSFCCKHLGEADDGVQRGPQLVAHVGQELGLVLGRDLQCLGAFCHGCSRPPISSWTGPPSG